jgi:hypothetical protein
VDLFQVPKLRRDSAKLHAKRKCALGPRLSFIAKAQERQCFKKHRQDPKSQGSQKVDQRPRPSKHWKSSKSGKKAKAQEEERQQPSEQLQKRRSGPSNLRPDTIRRARRRRTDLRC